MHSLETMAALNRDAIEKRARTLGIPYGPVDRGDIAAWRDMDASGIRPPLPFPQVDLADLPRKYFQTGTIDGTAGLRSILDGLREGFHYGILAPGIIGEFQVG